MVYQLAQGTGIPITFIMNGYLLKHIHISQLYALGIIISGMDMGIMMFQHDLNMAGIALIGL
jgi:YQGE family putative transporter